MSEPEPTFHKLSEFEPTAVQNRDMLVHWKSLRDDQPVPLWNAFDPLDILKTLANCAIVEFIEPNLMTIRLFGSALVERLGEDITGKNLLDLFQPDQRAGVKARTDLLRTRPAVLRLIIASQSSMGVPIVAESMVFPFRGSANTVWRGLLSIHELNADEYVLPIRPDNKLTTEVLRLDVLDL